MSEVTRKDVAPDDIVKVEMPYSEVNMHMGIAGRVMDVLVRTHGAVPLNGNGDPFCSSITHGEAGIYSDGTGGMYAYVVGGK